MKKIRLITFILSLILSAQSLYGSEEDSCSGSLKSLLGARISEVIQFTDKTWAHIDGEFSGSKIKSGLHTFKGIQQLTQMNPGSKVISLNPRSFQEYKDAVTNILNEQNHKNTIYIYKFMESNSIAAFVPGEMMNAKAKSATYISAISGRGHYLTKSLWPQNYARKDIESAVRKALSGGYTQSQRRDQILYKTRSGITVEVKEDTLEVITAYREVDQMWLGEILMNSSLYLDNHLGEIFLDLKSVRLENTEAADWYLSERFGDEFRSLTHNYDDVLSAIVNYTADVGDYESLDLIEKAFTNFIMKQELQASDLLSLFKYEFKNGGEAVWDIMDEEIRIYPPAP